MLCLSPGRCPPDSLGRFQLVGRGPQPALGVRPLLVPFLLLLHVGEERAGALLSAAADSLGPRLELAGPLIRGGELTFEPEHRESCGNRQFTSPALLREGNGNARRLKTKSVLPAVPGKLRSAESREERLHPSCPNPNGIPPRHSHVPDNVNHLVKI